MYKVLYIVLYNKRRKDVLLRIRLKLREGYKRRIYR